MVTVWQTTLLLCSYYCDCIMTSRSLNTYCDVTQYMNGLWIFITKIESPKGDSQTWSSPPRNNGACVIMHYHKIFDTTMVLLVSVFLSLTINFIDEIQGRVSSDFLMNLDFGVTDRMYLHISRVSCKKGPHLPCVSMAGRALMAGYDQAPFTPNNEFVIHTKFHETSQPPQAHFINMNQL